MDAPCGRYDGGDMEVWLSGTPRPAEDAVFWALGDVLRGMEHMHSRGVVHCDVRARNVLMRQSPDSARWTAALSDFDISVDAGQRATRATMSTVAGPRGFEGLLTMAPEVRLGRACGKASDCYSFGGLVFVGVFGLQAAEAAEVDPQSQVLPRQSLHDETCSIGSAVGRNAPQCTNVVAPADPLWRRKLRYQGTETPTSLRSSARCYLQTRRRARRRHRSAPWHWTRCTVALDTCPVALDTLHRGTGHVLHRGTGHARKN